MGPWHWCQILVVALLAAPALGMGESSPWCNSGTCNRSLECRAPIITGYGIHELALSNETLSQLAAWCRTAGVEPSSFRAADSVGRSLPSNNSYAGRFFFASVGGLVFVYFSGADQGLANDLLEVPLESSTEALLAAGPLFEGDQELAYYDATPSSQFSGKTMRKMGLSFNISINDFNTVVIEVLDPQSGGWLSLGNVSYNDNSMHELEVSACRDGCNLTVDPAILVGRDGVVHFRHRPVISQGSNTHRINYYKAVILADYLAFSQSIIRANVSEAHHAARFELVSATAFAENATIVIRNSGGEVARDVRLAVSPVTAKSSAFFQQITANDTVAIAIPTGNVTKPGLLDFGIQVAHADGGMAALKGSVLLFDQTARMRGAVVVSLSESFPRTANASFTLEKVLGFYNPSNSTLDATGWDPCIFNFALTPNEAREITCLSDGIAGLDVEQAFSAESLLSASSSEMRARETITLKAGQHLGDSILVLPNASAFAQSPGSDVYVLELPAVVQLNASLLANQPGLWNHSIIDFVSFSHGGPHLSNITFAHPLREGYGVTLYRCTLSPDGCSPDNESAWVSVDFTESDGTLERNGDNMSFLSYAVAFDLDEEESPLGQPDQQQSGQQQSGQQQPGQQQPMPVPGQMQPYSSPEQKPDIEVVSPSNRQEFWEGATIELVAKVRNAESCYVSLAGSQSPMHIQNNTTAHVFSGLPRGEYSTAIECGNSRFSTSQTVSFSVKETGSNVSLDAAEIGIDADLGEVTDSESPATATSLGITGLALARFEDLAVPVAVALACVFAVAILRFHHRNPQTKLPPEF